MTRYSLTCNEWNFRLNLNYKISYDKYGTSPTFLFIFQLYEVRI